MLEPVSDDERSVTLLDDSLNDSCILSCVPDAVHFLDLHHAEHLLKLSVGSRLLADKATFGSSTEKFWCVVLRDAAIETAIVLNEEVANDVQTVPLTLHVLTRRIQRSRVWASG